MTDGEKTKPRLAGRGFAQSTWRLVAHSPYTCGAAGAITHCPFLRVPAHGAALGCPLLRGGGE